MLNRFMFFLEFFSLPNRCSSLPSVIATPAQKSIANVNMRRHMGIIYQFGSVVCLYYVPFLRQSVCAPKCLEPQNFPFPNKDETEGLQCLGHSNWTNCSPLSQFCSEIFTTFHFHTGEPILITPEG